MSRLYNDVTFMWLFCSLLPEIQIRAFNMTSLRVGIRKIKAFPSLDYGRRWMTSNQIQNRKLRKQDFEYCVDLVQNRDRESYLCGLLMPHKSRRSYFAIRAFNVELASIKDGSVSRQVGGAQFEESGATMALKVRIQWWRDAIGQIYGDNMSVAGGAPSQDGFVAAMASSSWNNPVVRVLDHAVHESNLTRRFLERLVETREEDLDVKQLHTLDEAITYAENTFSSLLYLSLETAEVSASKKYEKQCKQCDCYRHGLKNVVLPLGPRRVVRCSGLSRWHRSRSCDSTQSGKNSISTWGMHHSKRFNSGSVSILQV